MADIYLAISETPTVVTLTSAVINSAVASSVTVANTVTVALDSNSLSALENVTVTVGAAITGTVTVGNSVTISYLPAISGTVTVGVLPSLTNNTNFATVGQQIAQGINAYGSIPIAADWENANQGIGNLNVTATCVTSTNRIGVVTIGGGTVTIEAGTAQIGSVTASISGTVPVSGTFWQATQPVSGTFYQATQPVSLTSTTVTVSSLPALAAGTAQIGSVTASISGTVPVSGTFWQTTQPASLASLPALAAGTAQIGSVTASLAISSSAITSGSFTSLTSATLVPANTARKMATVYNLGAGQLFINAGASATTLGGGFMVALSSGDFYECDYTTTTLSAIFATAGTASWMSH